MVVPLIKMGEWSGERVGVEGRVLSGMLHLGSYWTSKMKCEV